MNDFIIARVLLIALCSINIIICNVGIIIALNTNLLLFSNVFSLVCLIFSAAIVILVAIGVEDINNRVPIKDVILKSPIWAKILLIIVILEAALIALVYNGKIDWINTLNNENMVYNQIINKYLVGMCLSSLFLLVFLAQYKIFKNERK